MEDISYGGSGQELSFQGPPGLAADGLLLTEDSAPPAETIAVANELCPEHKFPPSPVPEYMLKVPVSKAQEPAVEPPPTPAASAVSLEFLRFFLRRIPGGASGGASMSRVVEELIQPSTSATMTSYASQHFLVPRSHVSTPTWVVIHPWDLPVTDLVAALEDFAADLPPNRTHFWLSALAVSQHLLPPEAAFQPMDDGASSTAGPSSRATTPPTDAGAARLGSAARAPAGGGDRGGSARGGGLPGSGGGAGRVGEALPTAFTSAFPREALLSSTPPGTAGSGGGAVGADGEGDLDGEDGRPPLDTAASFAAQMRRKQKAVAAKQKAMVAAVRRGIVAATYEAVRAARCGALLVLGRDVRPLKRAWCLVELSAALRARGPEAITLLPFDRDFSRADLVRQLRDLNVSEVVAAADEHDREVLAEALGVPPPPPPGAGPPAGAAGAGGVAAAPSAAPGAGANAGRRVSLASSVQAVGKRSLRYSTSNAASPRGPAGGAGAAAGGAGDAGEPREEDDGCSGGRALVRQLQLALLLRPMDGALPARMMGVPLADANPVAMLATSTGATGASTTASAVLASSASSPSPLAPPATPTPCAHSWLWDWSPLASWLALPSTHPNWRALLVTGGHGAGKTTALAAMLGSPPLTRGSLTSSSTAPANATPQLSQQPQPQTSTQPPPSPQLPPNAGQQKQPQQQQQQHQVLLLPACHFCSAADARSLAAGEVVRSLAYQLACRSPGFAAALCGSLLELGGPGGGTALSPDAWLHGVEEVVAALLARPMEADANAHLARGDRAPTYLLAIDGLDEGPAAAAAAATALSGPTGDAETHESLVPRTPPRTYEVLRLVIDHLQHLPGVRLILSCTTGGANSSDSPTTTTTSGASTSDGASSGVSGTAAVAPAAKGGRVAKVKAPFVQPPPLVVAPRGAADAWASVYLAVRQAVRPAEVPLTALRRDKYLPLSLAHMLQEHVLSPELTARELLWQARDCLAHVHILQLLIQHAAERLSPPDGLMDGTAAAATAAATAAVPATAAAPAAASGAAGGTSSGETAAAAGAPQQARDLHPVPGQAAHPPQQPQGLLPQTGSQEMPPRPQTPPRQEHSGSLRQQRQSSSQSGGPQVPPLATSDAAPLTTASQAPDAADSANGGGGDGGTGPGEPPAGMLALGGPGTGAGGVAVHSLPPVCRGTLADEYGVLWSVRTAELRREATVDLVMAAESAAGGGGGGGAAASAGGRPAALHQRQNTISMIPVPPPPPPYAPERAARLQLLLDLLAAAQEPLEWTLLARAVLSAEVPAVVAAAAAAGGGSQRLVRVDGSLTPSHMPASAATVPASPIAARSPMRVVGPGTKPPGGNVGGQTSQADPAASPQLVTGRRSPDGVHRGRGGDADESVDESEWSEEGPGPGGPSSPGVGLPDFSYSRAAGALRDLEWALHSGPLAGLVWISGCGRVTIRHSSFLDWLRQAAATLPTTTPAMPLHPNAPSSSSLPAAVAAAGASSSAPGTPAGAPQPPPGVIPPLRHPLGPPRAQHGHQALARLLRQQLGSCPTTAASPFPTAYQIAAAGALGRSPSGALGYGAAASGLGSHPRWSVEGIAGALSRGLAVGGGLSAQQRQTLPLAVAAAVVGARPAGGGGERLVPYVTPYCLRHLVVHCVEGRLSAADIEAILLDLDYWRLVLEGGHVEMVASSLEHLLRTRGPHAQRPGPTAAPSAATSSSSLAPAPAVGSLAKLPSQAALASTGLLSPRTPPAGPWPMARGTPTAGAQLAAPDTPSGLRTPAHTLSAAATGPLALQCGGSGGGAAAAAAAAAARATAAAAPAPGPRPLPAATASLLRDALLWLLQDGHSLCRRPDPLAIACSASCTPLQSPFRKLAERLTTAAVATAEGLPTPTHRPPSAGGGASAAASAAAAAVAAAAAPPSVDSVFFPPSFVTALPHPKYRNPALREAVCSHRVTGLLLSSDGELVLASSAWTPQASLVDSHSGSRTAGLDAGPDAHASALAAPAFAPSRRFVATAGATPGAVTLWDPATGAPRLQLHMRRELDAGGTDSAAAATSAISGGGDGDPSASDDPWVTCIRVYEPGPSACASSYGATAGASFASTSYDSSDGPGAIIRGSMLLAAGDSSAEGRVVVWAVAPDGWSAVRTGELVAPSSRVGGGGGGSGVAALEFLPGGRSLLVVQGCSTTLRVWNIQSRNITATLRLPAPCGEILAVHLAPSSAVIGGGAGVDSGSGDTLLAVACTNATELWLLERKQRVASLPLGSGADGGAAWAETCVAFSPAGGLLATAGMVVEKATSAASASTAKATTPADGAGTAAAATSTAPVAEAGTPVVDPCGATLWDARSGARVAQLRSPLRGPVRALAFSPDGALLATAADGAVALWSATASACLAVLPLGHDVIEVPAVVFGRGGSVLLAAGGSAVYSWDVQLAVAAATAAAAALDAVGIGGGGGAVGRLSRFSSGVMSAVAVTAGGGGGRRGGLPGLDAGGHAGRVEAVCFSPNGALAVSGGEDNTLRLWDVARHAEVLFVELPGVILGVTWSPDGNHLAAALSNGTAVVWHTDGAATAAAAAAAAGGPSATAQVEFAQREAARLECSDGCSTVSGLGFSSDGKLLFTADGEGCAVVWSVEGWAKDSTFVPTVKASGRAAVAGAAAAAATGTADGAESSGPSGIVGRYAGVALSADGRWLLMGFGREVIVWNVKAKRESPERLGPHGAPVVAVAASSCGRRAAVGAGMTVTIWETPDAGAGGTRGGGRGVPRGSSPDGSRGVAPLCQRAALLPAMGEVTGLAFSADGSALAASLADGSVRVWETGRWREVGWLTGHADGALCVAFSPDGRVLMSGGGDGRCLSWSTRDVLVPRSGWKEGGA